MSWKNNKIWTSLISVLIFVIATITALKFDKFSFSFSNGKIKNEIKGEQPTTEDAHKIKPVYSPNTSSNIKTPGLVQVNKTKGNQSPAINNSNSTSTINYGTK